MRALFNRLFKYKPLPDDSPYHSNFGGMWIDRANARAELDRRRRWWKISRKLHGQIASFMKDGYVVLPGAVAPDVVDRLAHIVKTAYDNGDPRLFYHTDGKEHLVLKEKTAPRGTRLVESHGALAEVRAALSAPELLAFLWEVFDEAPVLTQTLIFHNGSEQGLHQDPAYVVFDQPVRMAAAWVALEDIQEGSGELQYMAGSHKLPDHVFSNGRRDSHGVPAKELADYLGALKAACESRGFERRKFSARKGDVLIWHADLAHGGSPITNPNATRQSLVGHFCPASAYPNYELSRVRAQDGPLLYSSYLYKLEQAPPPT